MTPSRKVFASLFFGILFLLFYCEFLVYYLVQFNCGWPSLDPTNEDPIAPSSDEPPLKVLVLADPHLLGSRNGHWLDKLRREWQMHRAFQTAITLHRPEIVFVLGDLLDEGLFCSDKEFEYYVKRFYSLFRVPESTGMFVVVGNHDIGFHYEINPYLEKRFNEAFNTSSVRMVSVRGNHFVLINSMALEGDGCFLCRPAELELNKYERIFKCSEKTTSGCETFKAPLSTYSRPILMQHYPLYRDSDRECNGSDVAPYPERVEPFRENWECISQGATHQILKQVKPRLVLSGHTHHGCTRPLPLGRGVEVTVPSFSWRNKNNPNYVLAVFSTNNYALSKCEMPKESSVVSAYCVGVAALLVWLVASRCRRKRRAAPPDDVMHDKNH